MPWGMALRTSREPQNFRAGFPSTVQASGTSVRTMVPMPTMTPEPTDRPWRIEAPAPMVDSAPIVTFPEMLTLGITEQKSPSTESCPTWEPVLMKTHRPRLMSTDREQKCETTTPSSIAMREESFESVSMTFGKRT